MAGKKSRKRQTASKKKNSKGNAKGEVAVCEEKKPKLGDDLEEQAEQPEKLVERQNVETTCTVQVAETVTEVSEDLKNAEEEKYVPPFTRKPKRTLQRDRSLISPNVTPTRRSKRPWKGRKQHSPQQSPSGQQTTNMINNKDSPKITEANKDEEVDVVGLEDVATCSQENTDTVVSSASQTAANKCTVLTDDALSSAPVDNVQEGTSAMVMCIIDDVLDAMEKSINQCNSYQEIVMSELNKELKETADGRATETELDANTINEVQDGIVAKAASEPSLETVTNIIPAPAAKVETKITAKEASTNKSLDAGSESQIKFVTVQQNQGEATTTQSVEGHVTSSQETATLESAGEECEKQVKDPASETLQKDIKFESPCTLQKNENDDKLEQQREADKELKGECVNIEEGKAKNLGVECSAVTTSEVKDVVLFSNPSTVCPVSCGSEEKFQQQKAGDDSFEVHDVTAEHTGSDHKPNTDTPMLPKEKPCTVDSDIIQGDNDNATHQHDSDQDLDQMVPSNCESTTMVLQEYPDVKASLRNPKEKEKDLEDSANVSFKPFTVYSSEAGEREHKSDEPDEMMDISVVETGTSKELNGSPPLHTDQASDIYMDQEPIMDQTVTCKKQSPLQKEPLCKQGMPAAVTTKMHKTENQSSKMEVGCSVFGFDDDITEFDCLMDCTDSQLVHLDESLNEKPLPVSQTHNARQVNNNSTAANSTSDRNQCSIEVPSDRGMIKGLISELSGLNKFIMGAWKDLENQKKRRQARLKLSKAKKLK